MNSQEHPGGWKTSQDAARGQPIDLFPEMPSTDGESTCLENRPRSGTSMHGIMWLGLLYANVSA
jgi:hypothetical protein